MYITSRPMYWQ